MTTKNSEVFLKGTMILAISGMVVKIIGSLNWVFLSRILGGEGIGLYQMGFPIYLMALTLSSAGIPVAISILTSEKIAQKDYTGARRVFTISRTLLFCTGLFFMLIMLFGAKLLVEYQFIRDARAYWSIIALSPAVFLVTFMSSMRGYLQGWQKMQPTAASEIIEQLFRVATMIYFAWLFLPHGLEYGAAGASMGAAVGALMALLLLAFCVKRLNKICSHKFMESASFPQESNHSIIKRIFSLAIPISMSSLMLPVVANLDMMIVPMRLEVAGFDIHKATELFGYLTGMAIPLTNLATLLTAALAIALVPAISESRAKQETETVSDKTGTAFRIATAITIPSAAAIYIMAEPIASIVYNSPQAAAVIKASSPAIFFLGLHQVSTGVLQGLGMTKIPVISMVIAACLKVALNWQLVAVPELGITGAAYATIADISVAALINMVFIWKYTKYLLSVKTLTKIIVSAALMVAAINAALLSSQYIGAWSLLLAVIAGTAVYIPIVLVTGGLPGKDACQVPILGSIYQKIMKIR